MGRTNRKRKRNMSQRDHRVRDMPRENVVTLPFCCSLHSRCSKIRNSRTHKIKTHKLRVVNITGFWSGRVETRRCRGVGREKGEMLKGEKRDEGMKAWSAWHDGTRTQRGKRS